MGYPFFAIYNIVSNNYNGKKDHFDYIADEDLINTEFLHRQLFKKFYPALLIIRQHYSALIF